MNGIEFETDKLQQMQKMAMVQNQGVSSSQFSMWLMKKGIVSSDAGAQKILIGIIVLNIIIIVLVIKWVL